jgi:beta-RFAP synthase
MPPEWRCILTVPDGKPGLSGEAEAQAFERLPAPAEREVERVAHLVLMQLLPALADRDLPAFGSALSEVQRITGGWFAEAQGGPFAPGVSRTLIDKLAGWGASGVGQSSWGPAVYGIAATAGEAELIAGRCREFLGDQGRVYCGPFSGQGAIVTVGDGRPQP